MVFIFIPVTNPPAFHCPRDKRKCELSRVNAGNTYVRSAGRRILCYTTAAGLVYSGAVHSKTVHRLRYIIYIYIFVLHVPQTGIYNKSTDDAIICIIYVIIALYTAIVTVGAKRYYTVAMYRRTIAVCLFF